VEPEDGRNNPDDTVPSITRLRNQAVGSVTVANVICIKKLVYTQRMGKLLILNEGMVFSNVIFNADGRL
jgi:hypothetical protein